MKKEKISFIFYLSLLLFLIGFSSDRELVFASSPLLSVAVSKGRITLEAEKAPLELVLREVGQKTGIRFIYPSSLANDSISVSFKDLSFSEAIGRILRNYSYLMEGEEFPDVTIVASKGSGEVTARPPEARVTTIEGKGPSTLTPRETTKFEQSPSPVSQPSTKVEEPRPYDLDECVALQFSERDAAQELSHLYQVFRVESDEEGLPQQGIPLLRETQEAIEKRLKDAKIERAKKVLEMERCSNLWSQAIEELSQFQDDRVTAILIEVAQTGKTARLREKATEALWYNTADSEFKNMKGVEALRKLSQSSDPRVSAKAKQAIQGYERYIKRHR